MEQPPLTPNQRIAWDYHDRSRPIWAPHVSIFREAAKHGITQAQICVLSHRFRMLHQQSPDEHTDSEWQMLFIDYLEAEYRKVAV